MTGNRLVDHPVDLGLTCGLGGLQRLDGKVLRKHSRLEGCCLAPGDSTVTSLTCQRETDYLNSHKNSAGSHPVVLL